jgi:hypothetical protein
MFRGKFSSFLYKYIPYLSLPVNLNGHGQIKFKLTVYSSLYVIIFKIKCLGENLVPFSTISTTFPICHFL